MRQLTAIENIAVDVTQYVRKSLILRRRRQPRWTVGVYTRNDDTPSMWEGLACRALIRSLQVGW
jgi:hypothetical protein